MFYDLDSNTNSYSRNLKSYMKDFIIIIIIPIQSEKGFSAEKKCGLHICTKSYAPHDF